MMPRAPKNPDQTIDRTPRSLETREEEERVMQWKPPSLLPDPDPQDGYVFRWIRVSSLSQADIKNASSKFREGWVAVKASEHKELAVMTDESSRFPENIEIGGLLLCKMPVEMARQRQAHYQSLADAQLRSVNEDLMRESDPRMPLNKPERVTEVSFGSSRNRK